MATSQEMAAWIGLDWADEQHEVRLRVSGQQQVEVEQIKNDPADLQEWIGRLRKRFAGRPVAIALEQSRGGLMAALMGHDFIYLYPVNPRTLSLYRQALSPSGKKDDPDDALLLLELVQGHSDRLRRWKPDTVATRQLQLLTEGRRHWVEQRKRFEQQLVAALKGYYPQPLQWFEGMNRGLLLDFLSRYPSLQQARRARRVSLRALFRRRGVREADSKAASLQQQIGCSCSLTEDPALLEAGTFKVLALVEQLRSLMATITSYEKRIAQLFAEHEEGPLFRSFHGAGPALAPRLLASLGTDRSRFADAREVQQWSGIAPVTRRSGRSCQAYWRRGCPKFVRQTFHEFAACSLPHSRWARAYYLQQRGRGLGHHAAVRALAYKWIRILFRCWKNRTPYDEQLYCESLKRKNSKLFALMQELSPCG